MYKEKSLLFYLCQTGVHCGSGSSLEVIDLPIQREKHTNFPIFQGSSVKGTLRRFYEQKDKTNAELIFGPEKDGSEYASCISVTDAKVLFFPVKSFKGVFVWVTCPMVLERFSRELNSSGGKFDCEIPEVKDENAIILAENSNALIVNGKLVVDEYVLTPIDAIDKEKKKQIVNALSALEIPEKKELFKRAVIVSNDLFTHFVTAATEVIARTKINDETGVVEAGALWYEEYLPAETFLYSFIFAGDTRKQDKESKLEAKKVVENLKKNLNGVIQFGGNETIGKGLVQIQWSALNKEGE